MKTFLLSCLLFVSVLAHAENTFTKINYNIKGSWRLEEKDGKQVLILDESFKTRNAPDLKLFLSPLPIEQVTNENATTNSAFVAELTRNKGAQTYTLPDSINLSDYKSLVIHCQKFTKVWGGANLK